MKVYVTLILISALIPRFLANNVKRGEESKYTKAEIAGLAKLRALVKDALYADYMHRDEYLISWLRTRNLDPARANEFLRANLKWRKDEKIDDLENEAFPQFEKAYPFIHGAKDKEGRPVTQFLYTVWDTRKVALSGQMKQLIRYLVKNLFELPSIQARKEGQADGTNATQYIVLADLTGYNLRQHACVRCFEFYLGYIESYEYHYPQTAWQTLAIGTPSIFQPVVTLLKPIFTPHLAATLHLLGPDRKEWKNYLDTIISPDQLNVRFGGTSRNFGPYTYTHRPHV